MLIHLQHPERLWMAAVWLGLVVALLVMGYKGSGLRGWRRAAAVTCKLLAAALLALCLLDPVSVSENPRKGANEIVVLADNSASLSFAEQTGADTRGAQLSQLVSDAQGKPAAWMEKLRDTFRVRVQSVDERVQPIADARGLKFDGTRNALCSAISTARDRRASNVAAVVVLSAGNATDSAAWKAVAGGAPVFPVVIGSRAPERDLSLREVSATQSAFEDAPVAITAKVTQTGFADQEVVLKISDESGKVLQQEKHRFIAQEASYVFRPRVPLAKPGISFLTLRLSGPATLPETVMANNERLLTVDRGAGPYRVLYVSGRPNWDNKFMRRAMTGDPEVQLPSLIRIARREPKFAFRGRGGEASNPLFRGFTKDEEADAQRYDQPVLIRLGTKDKTELVDGFPKTPETLMAEYRAIILDDVEAAFFTQEQMNLMEKFVSVRGGSLLMLGGVDTFQSGSYDNTPVGRMLPVYLDKLGGTGEPIEDARLALTREGWLEPWMRLRTDQGQDEQRVAAMPGFWTLNPVSSIKPGATILATATDKHARQYPALVTQRYGSGQVLAFTLGDIWQWAMADDEHHADMDKFWRQLLRAMVTDAPDRIELKTTLTSTGGQDNAQVLARVRDAAFRAQDDASVEVKVTSTQKDVAPALLHAEPALKEPGVFTAEHYPHAAGGYRVQATVKDAQGQTLGERTTGFALNPLADLLADLAPNRALLQRIASETGGQVFEPANIAALTEALSHLDSPVMDRKAAPLWHNGWVLALLIALLAGEWALRRSAGVV